MYFLYVIIQCFTKDKIDKAASQLEKVLEEMIEADMPEGAIYVAEMQECYQAMTTQVIAFFASVPGTVTSNQSTLSHTVNSVPAMVTAKPAHNPEGFTFKTLDGKPIENPGSLGLELRSHVDIATGCFFLS